MFTSENSNWEKWDFVDSAGLKEYIEIKISDTGYGISNDDLPKIFEPFFSTKGQKGNGLGLAVIWGIIDNHNGTINVESEVGKGTTFTIRLPLSSKNKILMSKTADILVIDDEQVIIDAVVKICSLG